MLALAGVLCAAALVLAAPGDRFAFAILGDRTGEAQPGVYEEAWKEAAAESPAFVINAGDTIEGGHDDSAEAEWREAERVWAPFRKIPLYLIPGNHDIWSAASEELFRRHARHAPHYSFDYGGAHFTVLDNSRTDDLPAAEIAYLEEDLKAHAAAPVKFIFSHRPSWILQVGLHDPDFPLHRLAKQYGVQYVIAGHLHQMLRFELEGITYISMVSSGGHLRLSKAYADGWFFGHAVVRVTGREIDIQVEELRAPHGEGRVTKGSDWGMAGLVKKAQRAAGGSVSAGIAAR